MALVAGGRDRTRTSLLNINISKPAPKVAPTPSSTRTYTLSVPKKRKSSRPDTATRLPPSPSLPDPDYPGYPFRAGLPAITPLPELTYPKLPTPPDSSERLSNLGSPSALSPASLSPSPPPSVRGGHTPFPLPTITTLTPRKLLKVSLLARTYTTSNIALRCSPTQFSDFYHSFRRQLDSNEYYTLWEYDARTQEFIIKCMPSPIHEKFASYASFRWSLAIAAAKGEQFGYRGVSLLTNSDIKTKRDANGAFSRRIPDLATCVRAHSATDDADEINLYSIIIEVGFTQTLQSLRSRARMWLENKDNGTHLVVLIDITETPQAYAGVSKSKAHTSKVKFAWPAEWFGGRGAWEEVQERGGHVPLKVVRAQLEAELKERLMVEDKGGRLVPALLEPLEAAVYVYRRKPDAGTVGKEEPGQSAGGAARQTDVKQESEPEEREDYKEDYDEDDEEESSEEEEQISNSSAEPSNSNASSTTPPTDDDASSSSSSSDDATASFLELIYTHPLLCNSQPVPNLTTQRLQFSIAELYGPLPIPTQCLVNLNSPSPIEPPEIPAEVLALIPPATRPAAAHRIVFELQDIAEELLEDKSRMKARRAEDRAREIVGGVWGGVEVRWKREREGKIADGDGGNGLSDRTERWVRRQKRGTEEVEGGEGKEEGEEEESGAGEGKDDKGKGRGRGRKLQRRE